jgi:hypothetical protein
MLFQEYDFKICVKLGKSNVKPNYLSWRWNRELEGEEEGDFPNANMFKVPPASGYLEDVHYFLWHKKALDKMSMTNRWILVQKTL